MLESKLLNGVADEAEPSLPRIDAPLSAMDDQRHVRLDVLGSLKSIEIEKEKNLAAGMVVILYDHDHEEGISAILEERSSEGWIARIDDDR